MKQKFILNKTNICQSMQITAKLLESNGWELQANFKKKKLKLCCVVDETLIALSVIAI